MAKKIQIHPVILASVIVRHKDFPPVYIDPDKVESINQMLSDVCSLHMVSGDRFYVSKDEFEKFKKVLLG